MSALITIGCLIVLIVALAIALNILKANSHVHRNGPHRNW